MTSEPMKKKLNRTRKKPRKPWAPVCSQDQHRQANVCKWHQNHSYKSFKCFKSAPILETSASGTNPPIRGRYWSWVWHQVQRSTMTGRTFYWEVDIWFVPEFVEPSRSKLALSIAVASSKGSVSYGRETCFLDTVDQEGEKNDGWRNWRKHNWLQITLSLDQLTRWSSSTLSTMDISTKDRNSKKIFGLDAEFLRCWKRISVDENLLDQRRRDRAILD